MKQIEDLKMQINSLTATIDDQSFIIAQLNQMIRDLTEKLVLYVKRQKYIKVKLICTW